MCVYVGLTYANLASSPRPFHEKLEKLGAWGQGYANYLRIHGGYPVVGLSCHTPTANGPVEPILSIWPLVSVVVGTSRLLHRIHTPRWLKANIA